jgi:hypothetical protein
MRARYEAVSRTNEPTGLELARDQLEIDRCRNRMEPLESIECPGSGRNAATARFSERVVG